jgi:hypothetical protein
MLMSLSAICAIGLSVFPISADFILCPGGFVTCFGTDNADVINGSNDGDNIEANDGDDFISGGDRDDNNMEGNAGNDILFGGLGADDLKGGSGNDFLFAGPDAQTEVQFARGNDGNDIINVLVGETANCLNVVGGPGFDVVNLIGFGPYTAIAPFAEGPIAEESAIIVIDPIAGGLIIIDVDDADIGSIEVIHGLLSPDVTVIDVPDVATLVDEQCERSNK